jgi:hypothetical protein
MSGRYHQLVGSLPHLPGFARLKVLPIGPQRFEDRLALLDNEDAALIARLRAALWPEQGRRPGAEAEGAPMPPTLAALAERATAIRADFAARRDEEDVANLEEERLAALWEAADRLTRAYGFDFDAVLRAVIRWDIAAAWLAADEARSAGRIGALADRLVADWTLDAA